MEDVDVADREVGVVLHAGETNQAERTVLIRGVRGTEGRAERMVDERCAVRRRTG